MKQLIPNYTFDASAKTVTFTDFTSISLERVLLITNVTTNTIIYNFAATGGTVAGNVLTLDYDTTAMADTDDLSIQYESAPGDPDYARITNVETERNTWRRNFNGASLDPTYWNLIQTGTGMSVDGGSGNLTITTGTTANSETIIRSLESFKVPFRIQWHHALSQRIANQEFYLELTNAAGDTYVGYLFDGTSTTAGKTVHMNGGYSAPASPTAAITMATSSTTPVIREIEVRPDAVYFTDRTADSTASGTNRAVKTRTILDPDEYYFVQMRAKNLGTAPASSTTMTIETIIVQDSTKFKAEISGGTGNNAVGMGIPVVGSVSTTLTTTSLSASTSTSITAPTTFRNAAVTNTDIAIDSTTNARLWWFYAYNPNASDVWVHFYNLTTANTTVGTSTPAFSIRVSASGDVTIPQGAVPYWSFTNAMTIACTTSYDHTVTTAPTTPILVEAGYI